MRPEVKVTKPRLREGDTETVDVVVTLMGQRVTISAANADPGFDGDGFLTLSIGGSHEDDTDPPHIVLFDRLMVDDERITMDGKYR